MVDLNDDKILSDPIQFKLYCAQKCLEKIPTFVPLAIDEKIIAEMNMESFLFFAVGALDIIFQEINKRLNLNIKPVNVRRSTVENALKSNQTNEAKTILKQIYNYFHKPEHMEKMISDEEFNDANNRYNDDMVRFWAEYENRNGTKYQHSWNRDDSKLWELKNQRNLVAHDSLLKKAGLRGTVPPKDYLRVRLDYNDKQTVMWDSIHYENPKEYYTEALDHVKQFIDNIKSILKSTS